MEKKYITVEGVKIYHGDKISAVIEYCEEECEVKEGRLCINSLSINTNGDISDLYICQNEYDGDSSANEFFGYRFSWNFKVDSVFGKITSHDTYSIKSLEKEYFDEDDDPMPEDWVCEEKIPEDL